jgi:hypothetical protein
MMQAGMMQVSFDAVADRNLFAKGGVAPGRFSGALRMSMHRMIMFLIFLTAQAMTFGLGTAIVLVTPSLAENVNVLLPAVNVASLALGALAAWLLTPIVRARYAAKNGVAVRTRTPRREM